MYFLCSTDNTRQGAEREGFEILCPRSSLQSSMRVSSWQVEDTPSEGARLCTLLDLTRISQLVPTERHLGAHNVFVQLPLSREPGPMSPSFSELGEWPCRYSLHTAFRDHKSNRFRLPRPPPTCMLRQLQLVHLDSFRFAIISHLKIFVLPYFPLRSVHWFSGKYGRVKGVP